jgi:hypothetical protein
MSRYWRAYLRFGIGGWILLWVVAVPLAIIGYPDFGPLWWAGFYWPVILVLWLLVLLAGTAARATRAARSARPS